MKLLKTEGAQGFYLNSLGNYDPIDRISKDDLLRLVDIVLRQEDATWDRFDDIAIKQQAHQIIYKSVAQKLQDLQERRQEYIDQTDRLFLAAYEKYRGLEGAK